MNKTYLTTIIASLALGSCIAASSNIAHAADNNVTDQSFTAVGLLATQATCEKHSINTIIVNVPGFTSRAACEKFLVPNAHTKDFLGTDGEICRINYNFDGLCVALHDETM